MPRRRLGVALLVPAPVAIELQGLRRALGDPVLERVPPHVTLLPPVNVAEGDLRAAVALVARAATSVAGPLHLTLGPVATFAPVTDTVHLGVGGPDLAALHALRAAVHCAPLARPDVHPYVAHVTLAAEAPPARVAAALAALDGYGAEIVVDRVHVLAQHPDRVWRPLADAGFGPAAPSGRGGFEVATTVTDGPCPDGAALLAARGLTVTATIGGAVVGVARGWSSGSTVVVAEVTVAVDHRSFGVGRRLLAALEAEAATRDCSSLVAAAVADDGARSFLAAAGWQPVGGDDGVWRRLSGLWLE